MRRHREDQFSVFGSQLLAQQFQKYHQVSVARRRQIRQADRHAFEAVLPEMLSNLFD